MNDIWKKNEPVPTSKPAADSPSDAAANGSPENNPLEAELQESAARFKTIFNHCTDAILTIEPKQRRIIDVNERACEIFGYSRSTFLSLNLSRIFPRQLRTIKRFLKTVLEKGRGQTDDFSCVTARQEGLLARVSAWPIDIEGNPFILAFVQDIGRQIETEEALWQSEQKLGGLIENMQEGVMIVDNGDVIQFVNNRICELLGYDEAEIIGKVGYKLLFNRKDQRVIREKNRLRTKNIADKYEIEICKSSGEPLWVLISGVPLTDSAGMVKGSFGIITDISERKAAEADLQKARDDLEKRIVERTKELLESNDNLQREINERRAAEAEREKFISLVENSNDVITMASPRGQLLYVNAWGKEVLGLNNLDDITITERSLVDLHSNEVRDFIKDQLIPMIVENGSWQGELPLRNLQSGHTFTTLFNGFVIRHPSTDKIIALATISRDITARKLAEEALQMSNEHLEMRVLDRTAELSEANKILKEQILERQRAEEQLQENEKKYRLLFNSGNDAVFVHYPRKGEGITGFVEVNDVACEKLGYTRDELRKLSPKSLFFRYDTTKVEKRFERLFAEKHILYEDVFITRQGFKIPVEISAHLFKFDDQWTVMSIARDITARLRAEEQIRDQAALLDKAQDAILVCDLNDYVIYWNKSAERLYGWHTAEAIGNNAFELLFKNNSSQFIAARRAVLSYDEWQGELHQVTKDGRSIVVESRWTLVHDNHDEAKSILVVNTDVTEKKKIEAQFLRAQRMESIGSLAGGIAHDLNNVLAPILTAVQILQVRIEEEKCQRILTTIESNVKRGADMVKQILTFARGVEGERIPLQPQHLIHDLERIALETFPKSIHISTDISSRLWTVSGDATQLNQVLLNLCVNARDAMEKGGTLRIGAENIFLDEKFVRLHLEAKVGTYVRIRVADTGIGIPDSIINKIFEPFFTTKEVNKGTGLGLSTAIAIVKSHGGFVNVTSEVGKGTTFEVFLPASDDIEVFDAGDIDAALPFGNGELILVVDDETSILDITSETLETYGYSVVVARDGAEAVGVYAQNKDAVKAVLTDMMMPVMDGAATIRALKKIKPDVRIIASSGFMEDAKVAEFISSDIDAFLHKPYTAEKLLDTLDQVLNSKKV